MNTDIQALHELLLAQHAALFERLGEEADPEKARAILLEMKEVLHRIDVAQNLLFARTSAGLEASIDKVRQADAKLKKALSQAKKAGDFIKAGAQFLKLVDQALDLAKKLALI